MFDKNKTYWIVFKGDSVDKMRRKGKVIEEAVNIIKVEGDNGFITFIPTATILSINEAKDTLSEKYKPSLAIE
jgi:hypothetical protein